MERVEKLRALLAENPADNFVEHALALEHVKMGDDETAKHLFSTLLTRDPKYVGSYYHLGKLLERLDKTGEAVVVYEKGMEQAKAAGDNHSFGELKGAWEELTF